MAYLLTRAPRGKHQPEAPLTVDGEPWPAMVCYGGGKYQVFADDVEDLVGVLTGDPEGYLDSDEQARLVSRIKVAIRYSVVAQAEQVHYAQCDGRWDRLTLAEREALLSPRFTQPPGLFADVYGKPVWVADVPLVVVETGYEPYGLSGPLPAGPPECVWAIDPREPESLLADLSDRLGAIEIYIRSVDG